MFYELAVRHAARKPIIHLITKGQDIPFDVSNMRAVPYALNDPDVLEEACKELARKVDSIEQNGFEGRSQSGLCRSRRLAAEGKRGAGGAPGG